MKKIFTIILAFAATTCLWAQVTTIPEHIPTGYTGEITFIFDPHAGDKGMIGATQCYAHMGLITSESNHGGDWKYIINEWREDSPKGQCYKEGDVWKLTINNMYDFFGCPTSTDIERIAMVFHEGSSGTRTGRAVNGSDIFVYIGEYYKKCGTNLFWEYNSTTHTISITGSGNMFDFGPGDTPPWNHLYNQITHVSLSDGVTSIGDGAFDGCSALESISIPSGVTSIGDWAFDGCSGLTSVTIPNSVTSIGEWAFYGCQSLSEINIPNSVKNIKDGAFMYCTSLQKITIGGGVEYIGNNIFTACYALSSITIDSNNKSYDSRENCSAIIQTATNTLICGSRNTKIPNSVTRIGENAFAEIDGIEAITIPESVTDIGINAFLGCIFVKEKFINNSSLDATKNAFWGASFVDTDIDGLLIRNDTVIGCRPYVTSANIPNNVTSIGRSAFTHCFALSSITIPTSVISIGATAFYNCSALESIVIPNSVISIGDGAFQYRSVLKSITCNATTPPDLGTKVFEESNNIVCHIPCGTKQEYEASDWSNYMSSFDEYAIQTTSGNYGDNITWNYAKGKLSLVGSGSMSELACIPWELYIDSISEINIAHGITTISEYAFANHKKLIKLSLPATLDEIAANAFANCPRLYDIYSLAILPPLADVSSFTNYNADVYVPCDSKEYYQKDLVWGRFNNIQCISTTAVDNIVVEDNTKKILKHGQLFIFNNENTYTITGGEVE